LTRWTIHRVLGVVGAAWLAGCAAFSPTPSPTSVLSAHEVATRSAGRMLTVQSLHFSLQLTGALDYIDSPPTIALKEVEGELARPDDLRALVKLSSFGIISQVGLIRYGTELYVTNPINQRWEKLPTEWGWYIDPTLPFDPEYGVPAILPTLDLDKVGVEEIEGRLHYHLNATTDGDYLAWWTMGMIPEGAVIVDVWIDTETFLLRRVTLVETASDSEDPTVWDIELSAFDQPVEIEPPPIGSQ
jgi:lipoprotein LprG